MRRCVIVERTEPLDDADEGGLDIEVLLRQLRGLGVGRPGRSPSMCEHMLLHGRRHRNCSDITGLAVLPSHARIICKSVQIALV